MSGLGEVDIAFQAAGQKVTPNEIDWYNQYQVVHPSISATQLGTVTSATANPPFVFDNVTPDYPRNLLFSILGVAGGMGGTAVINGVSRFGVTISETFAIGSAASGGSVAGTHIFAKITSGTLTGVVGLGGTAIGTARIGYAIGTSTTLLGLIGLPIKLGAITDVKSITWSSQGVGTIINGGTIGTAQIDASNYTYRLQTIMAGTEVFNFTLKSTYSNLGKPPMAAL